MKKLISIVLSLIMTSGLYVSAEENLTTAEKTAELQKYGITELNKSSDENITRAEFCKIVTEAMGIPDAESLSGGEEFTDVDNSHWAYPYISFAKASGLISGYGNGEFMPDNAIALKEALKILVCALGYGIKAEAREPYPVGYIKTAAEITLISDVSDFEKSVTKTEATDLLYTALDVPLLMNTSFGADITYTAMDGKNGIPLVTLRTRLENR